LLHRRPNVPTYKDEIASVTLLREQKLNREIRLNVMSVKATNKASKESALTSAFSLVYYYSYETV
jgi:hypothetical protein